MTRADKTDKDRVVEILSRSFDANKSVNYIIKQDHKREQRLRSLMAYSFDICNKFGDVFLSDDGKGCALILFPDKKKLTLPSLSWDIKLIRDSVGFFNIRKVLTREAGITKRHPAGALYYLWFIGVDPATQNKGTGSKLLQEIIEHSNTLNRHLCLETSTEKNLPWYTKHGFCIYNQLDQGYRLYFLKRDE